MLLLNYTYPSEVDNFAKAVTIAPSMYLNRISKQRHPLQLAKMIAYLKGTELCDKDKVFCSDDRITLLEKFTLDENSDATVIDYMLNHKQSLPWGIFCSPTFETILSHQQPLDLLKAIMKSVNEELGIANNDLIVHPNPGTFVDAMVMMEAGQPTADHGPRIAGTGCIITSSCQQVTTLFCANIATPYAQHHVLYA